MSHQEKLITTALAVTVATALTGCSLLNAFRPSALSPRDEQILESSYSLWSSRALPEGALPGFSSSLTSDPSWIVDEVNSVPGHYILNSTETGCQLDFFQAQDAGFDGRLVNDYENSFVSLSAFLGKVPDTHSIGVEYLPISDSVGRVEAIATSSNPVSEGILGSNYAVSRVFTSADVQLLISLTCFDGKFAKTIWDEYVEGTVEVTIESTPKET